MRVGGVAPAGRDCDLQLDACVLCRLFDRRRAADNDQVGQRDGLGVFALHGFEFRQHGGQFCRLVDRPVLLRAEANTRAIGAAALVRTAEG